MIKKEVNDVATNHVGRNTGATANPNSRFPDELNIDHTLQASLLLRSDKENA